MASVEDDYIRIPIPFAVPIIGITEPTSLSINKAQFQLLMRIVVFICTGFLFWPKIKGAFGFATGPDTEEQRKDLQERIAKIEHERSVKTESKKNYAVVTGSTESKATSPTSVSEKESAAAKRRKA